MIDLNFIEFYIKKKYSQKTWEYFDVTKQVISIWRRNNEVPGHRLKEFAEKEGSFDVHELLEKIYPKNI